MLKNLLLSIAVVFVGLIVFAIVFNLVSWLMAYIDYKKKCYELKLSRLEIASKLFDSKNTPQPPKEDL